MAEASYDHEKPNGLGKLIPEASGKREHQVLKAKGFGVTSSKVGIGYTPSSHVHFPIQKASVSVISANYEEEEQSSNLSKSSFVFDHIGRPISYISVFDRLGTQEDNSVVRTQGSIFTRLGHSTPSQVDTRGLVFTRLSHAIPSRLLKKLKAKREQSERTNLLPRGANDTLIVDQDSNEIRSSIPSCMKRITIWEVNTGKALTVKKCTMVTTNQELENEAITSVNHITIIEDTKEEPPIKDDTEDAPFSFEEGVRATVNELKEVNIGTTEDPRPIFINASLSLEEEDVYVELLKEYRDVFA